MRQKLYCEILTEKCNAAALGAYNAAVGKGKKLVEKIKNDIKAWEAKDDAESRFFIEHYTKPRKNPKNLKEFVSQLEYDIEIDKKYIKRQKQFLQKGYGKIMNQNIKDSFKSEINDSENSLQSKQSMLSRLKKKKK